MGSNREFARAQDSLGWWLPADICKSWIFSPTSDYRGHEIRWVGDAPAVSKIEIECHEEIWVLSPFSTFLPLHRPADWHTLIRPISWKFMIHGFKRKDGCKPWISRILFLRSSPCVHRKIINHHDDVKWGAIPTWVDRIFRLTIQRRKT